MKKTARNTALNLLARREHGVEELTQKLLDKDFDAGEVDSAIKKLCSEGLLSDERFIESYCRSRSNKGFGPLAIKNELRLKKLNEGIIEQVINQLDIDWFSILEELFHKKYYKSDLNDMKKKAKCWRFLSQRGFSSDQINRIINR